MDLLNSAHAKDSPLGRVNAATKIVLVALLTLAFLGSLDWVTSGIGLVLLGVLMAGCGLNPLRAAGILWPVVLAALFSGWATALLAPDTGRILLDLGIYRISTGSLADGTAIFLRGVALALVTVMLMATTDASEIGETLAQTFRMPARFVLSAVAAFRLVGILVADWQTLAAARRARGLGAGRGPVQAVVGFGQQGFSLMVQALRRASRLAVTMEARGFGAGPRTWLNAPVWSWRDAVALVLGLAVPVLAIGVSVALGTYRFLF